MKSMKRWIVLSIVALVCTSLACNLGGLTSGTPAPAQPSAPGASSPTATPSPASSAAKPAASPSPEPAPDLSQPVPLRQGLASLDSFVLVVSMVSNGPTTQDRSEMIYEVNYSSADDAYMVRTSNWETTADYPEPSTSESLQYTVGLKTCTESDGEYRVEEADPMANELQGVLLDMIDFTPIIANPVLVGQETVNGVETNHYTFLLDGLGVESGANVTKNEGEYWVAVDGQYLVKYYLAIEQRMEADGDFGGLQVSIELSSINQPIQITMPEGCQTAIVE